MSDIESEILELEKLFSAAKYKKSYFLNDWSEILNPEKFVKSHLSYIKANFKKSLFFPYLERLRVLKSQL